MQFPTSIHVEPSVSPGSIDRSDHESVGRTKFFRAGSPLFIEGDKAECVFRVIKGRVHLTTSGTSGPSTILRIVTEGRYLGISSVLLHKAYEGVATAAVPTTVEVVSRELFLQIIDHVPGFASTVALTLAREYSEMVEHSKRLHLVGNTQERIARFLVGCLGDESPGMPFELPYTHDEIGGMIGRSRETVTRTFTLFKQQGIIDTTDHMLKILRPDSLLILAGPLQISLPDEPLNGSFQSPAMQRRGLMPRLSTRPA